MHIFFARLYVGTLGAQLNSKDASTCKFRTRVAERRGPLSGNAIKIPVGRSDAGEAAFLPPCAFIRGHSDSDAAQGG